MSGIHKTALFLSGLPEEASATLLQKLEPETASKVRVEMLRLKGASKETLRKAVAEFLDAVNTTETPPPKTPGPKKTPHNRMTSTFDREVSESGSIRLVPQTMESFSQGIDILTLETSRNRTPQEPSFEPLSASIPEKAHPATPAGLFGFLDALQPGQVRELLLFETPRIVAVLLTQVSPELAGQILEQLTEKAQKEVVSILFELEEIDEEILREIEAVLKERAENIFGTVKKKIGYAAARRILQAMDPAVSRLILDEKPVEKPVERPVEVRDPNTLKRPFAFEDLRLLPDRGLHEIFDAVDAKTVLLSLVGAPQDLIDRVFGKATPKQEKRMLRQYQSLAPIRQADIEAARRRVLEKLW